ncbi:PP2C family protein-serine/threonine phosphatase [Nonomuraea sp. NPDC050383]|uniref:PP2C family protein-serine/threonine phosphatase n=1 Tax=Nonomuraea sp. NPDC050383 TaxID=3364362 RepID=UPI0037AD5B83
MGLTSGFEELFEDAPCGFLVTDADGVIRRANRTFLTMTGRRAEDLVGRVRLQELLVVGDRIFYETHFAPLLALQSSAHEIAVDFRGAAGDRLPVLLNAVMKGEPPGPREIWVCVFAATDRRGYERELLLARQRAEQSEKEARELAGVLQASFVPPTLPQIDGIELAGVYAPAGLGEEVGGDFYDMYETRDGWALVIGDVSGKGVAAAVVTSLARYTLRAAPARETSPSAALASLHRAVVKERTDRFVTAVYAQVSPSPGGGCLLTLSLGGHPQPVHLTEKGPSRIGNPGTLLGMLRKLRLSDVTVEVLPGESVVFFTDGVVEARRDDELFGDERLERVLAASRDESASDMAGRLLHEVSAFQSGVLSDDVAIVALKVPETPEAPQESTAQ